MKTPAYLNVVWNTEDDYKLAILNQILAVQELKIFLCNSL